MTLTRIIIIGGPGSGKTWLAKTLADRTDLPVFSIDDLLNDSAGRIRTEDVIDNDARAAARADSWIIEGGNTRTYAERLARAECVIRLRPPRIIRLLRVLRRPGVTRQLLLWTWKYDTVFGPKDDAVVDGATGKVVYDVRSKRTVTILLAELPCLSGTAPSPISKAHFSV